MNQENEQRCRCYMKDCGCDSGQTEEYMKLEETGSTQDQIYLLKRHRLQVMEQLHEISRQVDCIDYVLHELQQNLKQ